MPTRAVVALALAAACAPPDSADRASPALVAAAARGDAADAVVEAADLASLARLEAALPPGSVEVRRAYSHLPLAHVHASAEGLRALLASADATYVHEVVALHATAAATNLALIGQPEAEAAGDEGAGAAVAVLDTGVDYTRAAFGSCAKAGATGCKVAYYAQFGTKDPRLDAYGHGTNVAGIVAEVAPRAKLLALDVFSGDTAWSPDILAAMDWVLSTRDAYGTVAVNFSIGGNNQPAPCARSVFAPAVAALNAAGILVVAASGNDASATTLDEPACVPGVVSVGAVYDRDYGGVGTPVCNDHGSAPDQVTCFSNSSAALTLLAPGMLVEAAGIVDSGTSQAAPHVSGALAVLRAAYPRASARAAVARLVATGRKVKDARNGLVFPRVALAAALGLEQTLPDLSLAIDGGARWTATRAVELSFGAPPAAGLEVCVSDGPTCEAWQPYAPRLPWTLPAGEGSHAVHAWLRDAPGHVTATPVVATIGLDTAPPRVAALTLTPAANGLLIAWRTTDALSGVAAVRFALAAGRIPPSCDTAQAPAAAVGTQRLTGLVSGRAYGLRLCAFDAAGNAVTATASAMTPRPE